MTRQTLMNQRFGASNTNFGRDHDIFSSAAECFREYLLGLATRVHVRGIEVIDTGVERPGYKLCGQLLIDFGYGFEDRAFRRSKRHRPESKARHNQPRISETCVLHGGLSWRHQKTDAAAAILRLSCIEVQVGKRNLRRSPLIEHP